jgi:uncharacterized phage protein (TIGR02218 family)
MKTGLPTGLLTSDQHALADCYEFVFVDGTRYWTTYPSTITYDGHDYSVGPGIEPGDSRTELGVKADLLSLSIYPDGSTINGLTMFQAATAGYFDKVKVTRKTAYMTSPGTVTGLITEFSGYVSKVEPASTEIKLSVQSLVSRMTDTIPRRKTGSQCPWIFCDSMCGLNLAAYSVTETTTTGSTVSTVRLTDSAATGFYTLGAITFNNGALAPLTRNIRSSVSLGGGVHEITLDVAVPSIPASGVSVTVTRGCDKTRPTCIGYGNLANLGGFPDVPIESGG